MRQSEPWVGGPEILVCPRCMGGPLLATTTPDVGYCGECGARSATNSQKGQTMVVTHIDHDAGVITLAAEEDE